MSDPRRHGFNRGFGKWHATTPAQQVIKLDRPTNHGWIEDGVSEIDGCVIFRLGDIARMKADLKVPGQWIGNVKVGDEWQGFTVSGALDQITAQIKEMANARKKEIND